MKFFLPEWSPQDIVMLAFPNGNTDWNYILDEAYEQYHRIIKTFCDNNVRILLLCEDIELTQSILNDCPIELIKYIKLDYNDTWTRDYGPLTVMKDDRLRAFDFGFNGWGLKFQSDCDNLVNLQMKNQGLFTEGVYKNKRGIILEGGSVETDGEGTILTTSRCLCSPNRNGGLSKKEAVKMLTENLGADHILMLDYGVLEGDDTDSHIDTLARLAPENTILFTGCRDIEDPQFEELLKMRAQLTLFRNKEGEPYNLIELPLPKAIYDADGQRLPATYANYLIMNSTVFIPTYKQPTNDMLAINTLKIAFPNHNIVGIDCTTLIKQHGSLHCATMQLPSGILNS